MKNLKGLCLASLLLSGLLPGVAAAQTNDAAIATDLFNAGKELMKNGDYAGACPKLEESARLDPKVGTFAKLADCDEKVNKIVAARSHWQKAVNLAEVQKDARLALAKENFDRLDKVVPKVTLSMDAPLPPELLIKIDGLEVSAATLGVPLPVEIGSHKVEVSAKGKKSWSTQFTGASGMPAKVAIPRLEDGASEPAVAAAPVNGQKGAVAKEKDKDEPAPKKDSAGGGVNPVVGYVLLGAGAVGVGLGTYFGITAISKNSDSNKNGCNASSNTCTGNGITLRNDAYSAGNISTISMIAGGVLAGAGVLVLTVFKPHPASDAAPTEGPKAALSVGPGSLMLNGSF